MRASALLAVSACSVESESVKKTALSGGISEVMRYLAAAEIAFTSALKLVQISPASKDSVTDWRSG